MSELPGRKAKPEKGEKSAEVYRVGKNTFTTKVLDLATSFQSARDLGKNRKLRTVCVDFESVAPQIRILIIDLLRLMHYLSGKTEMCSVPDPLSYRRLLLGESLLAKLHTVVSVASEILDSVYYETLGEKEKKEFTPTGLVVFKTERIMSDMDHYIIHPQNTSQGAFDVQAAIQKVCDLSPSAPSLVGQLRGYHRRHQTRA